MLTILLRLFFLLFGIVLASSGQANETMPVWLTQKDSGSSIRLSQGQILNVSLLGSGADGGYIWDVVPGAESILQQGEEHCIPASFCLPGMVGCPPMCTFTFKAIASGQATLKLIDHRRWEKGVVPLQTFEVIVIVDKGIPVPTLTVWGMIVFALLTGLSSAYCMMSQEIPQQ